MLFDELRSDWYCVPRTALDDTAEDERADGTTRHAWLVATARGHSLGGYAAFISAWI